VQKVLKRAKEGLEVFFKGVEPQDSVGLTIFSNKINCGIELPCISFPARSRSSSVFTTTNSTFRRRPLRRTSGRIVFFIFRQPGHQSAPTSTNNGRPVTHIF